MPEKPRKRLDVLLVERGLFPSRSKAREAVLEGQVYVDGSRADKAGVAVSIDADMEVNEQGERYVSRGGRKLEAALDHFPIKIEGRVALDVGASTGGFTDCLLKAGVKRVFALDVGQGLIDESLRRDGRVTVMEKINIRYATSDMFDEQPQLAVVDVSFISLKLVLPVLREVGIVEMVALVKPQFEAGRSGIEKGGVVRDGAVRERTVSDISKAATELGYDVQGPLESPLKGPKGNVEYFLYLRDNSLSKAQK